MSSRHPGYLRTAGENFTTAFLSLWSNRLRSILTTAGIVIGITTVTGVVSLIQGLNSQVATALGELGATTIYIQKIPAVMSGSARHYRRRPDFSRDDAEALEELPCVGTALAMVEWWARVDADDGRKVAVSLLGSGSTWPIVMHRNMASGRFFTEFEDRARRNVCVVGADVADRIFGPMDPLGRKLSVEGMQLTVVGVTESRGEIMGESQDAFIVVPLSIIHKWIDPGPGLSIVAVGADGFNLEDVYTRVETRMRMLRGLRLEDDNNFEMVTADQLMETYSTITGGIFAAMIAISGIALLVGSVGIANIMLVSVTERTREIGIRKALGARNSEILSQFLTESVILSLTGGVIGVSAGGLLASLIASSTPLPAVLEPLSVMIALIVCFLVGITAGVVPALRAARLDPVKALAG